MKALSLSRSDAGPLARWFWTIDKLLLALVLLLIGFGLIAVAAASPAAAHRYSGPRLRLEDLYFLKRQLFWVAAGVPVMLGISVLPIRWAKRLAIALTIVFGTCLFVVPFAGHAANGAVRWIVIGGFQFQPSEFLKPVFIVFTAWLLAARFDDRSVPTMELSAGLLAVVAMLLVRQPDFGQTALFAMVWLIQAMLAGMGLAVVGVVVALALAGLVAAYAFAPHVRERVDQFVTGTGNTFQIDHALDCFRAGGLFGVGPGDGRMKFRLPEAHTDYIFSVIGEEFGAIACIMLALLFLAIVVRVLLQLLDEDDPFVLLAASGLAAQFGLQAAINMMVNLNLMPSKGMTLPFVSHGGSSFLALSLGMGLLLALTRRNRFRSHSPYLGTSRA